MNRYLIIFIAPLVIIAVGGGAYLWSLNNPAPPTTPQSTTAPQPVTTSSPSQLNSQSKLDVEAALRGQMDSDHQETFYGTVIAGNYALQSWGDTNEAGEALLKYDAVQDEWSLVTWGGGTWSADELVGEGVPQDTASALLTNPSK